MIFDICLYALAIAATLALAGSNRPPRQREVHTVLKTIHTISAALPDDCFTDVDVPDYDELFTGADEIGNCPIYAEDEDTEPEEDFSDLLAIGSDQRGIDTRWFAAMGAHTLRTLGSLEGLKGARRWSKATAIANLTAHYALA